MIPCPKCGTKTAVAETRGDRRSRVCTDVRCDGRVTTLEVPSADIELAARLMRLVRGAT